MLLDGYAWGAGCLRETAARFMPTGGDWESLSCLASRKRKFSGDPHLPPRPLLPGAVTCLRREYMCHLVYIVILEPVSSNFVFSLG